MGSSQIQAVEPGLTDRVLVAFKTPLSGHVNPVLTTIALADGATAAGASVVEGVGVDRIRRLPAQAGPDTTLVPYRYEVRGDDGSVYQACTTSHAKDVVLMAWA